MMCRAERVLAREATWLRSAQRDAGATMFAEHSEQRLAAGESAYGDQWATAGIVQLIVELTEEAADLGAWGVLALQALDREGLTDATRAAIERRLHGAILAGARAHRELEQAHIPLRALGAQRFIPDIDGRCINCERAYAAHRDLHCPAALEPVLPERER